MNLDSLTIEKRAVNNLEGELLKCSRLNPIINTDDKGISWDGEIHFFYDKSKKKECWGGRCPIQVKGHAVAKGDLKKRTISYPVSVDDLKAYQQDGGIIYFVVYILDDENGFNSYKIFYNEFLPVDIGLILAGVREGQKTKNVTFIELPKTIKEKEEIVKQFIRDKGMQSGTAYECLTELRDKLSDNSSYVFWTPADFSFVGNSRPTYLYEKSKEKKGIYFPVGRICIKSVVAHNLPVNVRLDGNIYFNSAHVEFKSKGVIKSITFNKGLSLVSFKPDKTVKLRLTLKCTVEEFIYNLEFLRSLANGAKFSIDGIGYGEEFDFDFPIEYIDQELVYVKKIQQLLETLHVKKRFMVNELSNKNMTDLQYLYRSLVKGEHLESTGTAETTIGTYNAGILKFLVIRFVNADNKIFYHDVFNTKDLYCEMSDIQGKKYPSSIYVKMKKGDFLKFDNIYYPEIIRSVTEVKYSPFYGNLVNSLVLEMLDAYDTSAYDELLDSSIRLSCWLYDQEKLPVYFLNKMQSIRRKRPFTAEEENQIRDLRSKEDSPLLLAGFSAVLGNVDDYKYYLGKLTEDERNSFLMFPIKNVIEL